MLFIDTDHSLPGAENQYFCVCCWLSRSPRICSGHH